MNNLQIQNFISAMNEAVPFINKYQGTTLVVKYGGNAMINNELKKAVMKDLMVLNQIGVKVVLVHGGGPEIDEGLKLIGKEGKFIDGLRVTDGETIEVVQQVLAGKVNKSLVSMLSGKGIGLCGVDGNMILCKKLKSQHDLGFVGEIVKVDTSVIDFALNAGLIPVIATIGADEHGTVYNINADTVASEIAIALNAKKLVSMTDIAGVLMDKDDDSTLIPQIEVLEVKGLIDKGVIGGGMIPKIACCVDAVNAGVESATIIDGRVAHAILLEMFSEQGNGTLFYKQGVDNGWE